MRKGFYVVTYGIVLLLMLIVMLDNIISKDTYYLMWTIGTLWMMDKLIKE